VALQPGYGAAWRNFGIARRNAGRFAEAAEALERAAGLAPQDVGVLADLAFCLNMAGRHRDSVYCYDRARSIPFIDVALVRT
jgi:Flp pilus assembly protein TadD